MSANFSRKNPPVLPIGMRFSYTQDTCIIDFVDSIDSTQGYSFFAVALTKTHAKSVIEQLSLFINGDNEDDVK